MPAISHLAWSGRRGLGWRDMKGASYADGMPIAAIATPLAEGALGIVRVSGPDSLGMLAGIFSRPRALASAAGGTALHGWILEPEPSHDPPPAGKARSRIDEVVVVAWRAPASYSGEESAEIICHGSPAAMTAVLEACLKAGFRRALPGEFTLRAFMNGKVDLTRAEAVADMSGARTERARRSAAGRLSGELEEKVRRIRDALLGAVAEVEVQLDYAEGEDDAGAGFPAEAVRAILADTRALEASYASGRLAREGAAMVILGPTNSGKSSLFNFFLKEDRAIVSDIHGTTRDYLEAWIDLSGFPIRLYDTAGLRDVPSGSATDEIEVQGMRRALELASSADIVIRMHDAARPEEVTGAEGLMAPELSAKAIDVWSRADLSARPAPPGMIALSIVEGRGFTELQAAILERLVVPRNSGVPLSSGVSPGSRDGLEIASARQRRLLESANAGMAESLAAWERGEPLETLAPGLDEALRALGEILGEGAAPDILSEIFGRFCVGK